MSYSPGDVVWYCNPDFPEKRHPHIIIARVAAESYLVVSSTKVEKTKQRCAYIENKSISDPLKTFVQVPSGASTTITDASAVNGNEYFSENLVTLQQKEEIRFSAREGDRIGKELLDKIINAVCESPRISPELIDTLKPKN